MKAFVRFILSQRVLCNLIFILFMILGAWAMMRSPVEFYPNISFGKVTIDTFYPGASPADVEALITREIEDAIEDVEDIEYILSKSYRERSSILIKFNDDSDYQQGYDEIRFRVQGVLKDLPQEIDPPTFNYLDVNDWFPAVSINVYGDRSNRMLTLIGDELKQELRSIPGVKEVKLQGEYVREFHVVLDPAKMRSLGVTFDQVARALRQANVLVPAGDHVTPAGEFTIRVDERFRTRSQILDAIVRRDADGSFVRVDDLVSDARMGYRDPFVMTSVNGKDCITLQLIKTRGGNALKIKQAAQEFIQKNEKRLAADGVHLILTQDSTLRIRDSVRVLGTNLVLGVILVSLLISLVMGLRNAAITTIGIPFAFLVTVGLVYLTGNSLNQITLFAFVLVSGIIVDDAIMLVENIFRHLQMDKDIRDAVVEGAAEVMPAVIAATLTTIAAFLPMLIMTGSVGEFFALIPKAVSFALAASLFECLFIVPIHYLDLGPRKREGRVGQRYRVSTGTMTFEVEDTRFMAAGRRLLNRALALALRFRWSVMGLLALSLVLALVIAVLSFTGKANLIRVTFFPDDYSLYFVEVTGPPGAPIERTHEVLKAISKEIADMGPGMSESALAMAGFYLNTDYYPVWGNHLGHVAVTLPSKNKRRFADYPKNNVVAHLEDMKKRLAHFEAETGYSLRLRAEKDGPPEGKDVNIRVLGSNEAQVRELATRLLDYLEKDPLISRSITNLDDSQGRPGRVLRYKVLADRAAEYDLTPGQVALLAASVLNGRIVGPMRMEDEEIDLKLKVGVDRNQGLADALRVGIRDYPDGVLRLGDVCEPEFKVEPGFLNRFQGLRAINLEADLRPGADISAAGVVSRVQDYFETIRRDYPQAGLNFAGEFDSTRRSFVSLSWAFLLALLCIYLILATQFQSYMQPLIIISAVIFALVGVIFGTFFSRSLFTINSFIAIVGVTGVVVNDSLVLIEFINRAHARGESRLDAMIHGANVRLRPIILTTLTTTLGLLPMAIGFPEYSTVWGPMAMTFVTGLCTATLLTVIVIPVEWDLVTGRGRKGEKRRGAITIDIERIRDGGERPLKTKE